MAEAWDLDDQTLTRMLLGYRTEFLNAGPINVHAYKNDYTPIPGSSLGNYTEADFNGYAEFFIGDGHWSEPAVVDHVAITVNAITANFTYLSGAGSPQTIYGYYLTDENDDYMWGVRFGTPRTMNPGDILNIQPELRHRTYPYA